MLMNPVNAVTPEAVKPTSGYQDIEFEIGALASRHGISTDHARIILEKCGANIACIDEEARMWKASQPH